MTGSSIERTSILKGKRALVSGAGKGIGNAISTHFAANGADLFLISRSKQDIEKLRNQISEGYGVKCSGVAADVSIKEQVNKAVDKAISEFEKFDILVCAAGYPIITSLWEGKLHELEEDDFLRVFNVDVLGSFRLIKGIIPSMIKNKGGVIILFSSTPALSGYDRGAPYTVAKAANLGLVKELAYEYGRKNIRVYAIAPGNIRTQRTLDQLSTEEQSVLAEEAPLKRWGDPAEVAEVAVVLASDKMSFVTGQTIVVDGGTVML